MGYWTGQILSGGALAVDINGVQSSLQIGVSDNGEPPLLRFLSVQMGNVQTRQSVYFSAKQYNLKWLIGAPGTAFASL